MTAGRPRNAGTRTSVEFYEVAAEVKLEAARRDGSRTATRSRTSPAWV
jgi:hypothetical protein